MKLSFHVLHYAVDAAGGDWPLGTGDGDAGEELAPLKFLFLPIALYYLERDGFDAFVGCESMAAAGRIPGADECCPPQSENL